WDYCHQDVLVSQFIEGIPVSHIDSLKQANVNLKLLAERGVEIFFTQVFRDCFFHADMHAGNIFVDAREPDNPKYIAVDFGIMGSLNPTDQKYLATNFLAFFKRDYRKVAQSHIDSGWVPSHTRVDEFEASIRTVCEPMFEKPLKDISFGRSLLRLFQTARKFDMEIQPQLLLLQKTLLSVEGLGKQLYPELDLWHTAKPFLERWMKTHMGPKALIKHMREKLPFWFYKMPEIPEVMHNLAQHWHHEGLRKEKRPVPPKSVRNIILTTCSSILLLGGIFTLGYSHRDWILQYPTWVGGALCFLGLVLYVLPVRQ
ncbi:MAG TPA: AarF/UbiB family protein, partial [Gammaproteobacteria bacterium]|nr:AarF/UbiB family protein [Gammaproteobacteria bacterium]